MTTPEEKDWVLRQVHRAGMIDMHKYNSLMEQPEIARLFFDHRATFANDGLITEDINPPNNPNLNFYRVSLTDKGRAFLNDKGYTGSDEKQKKVDRDRVTGRILNKLEVFGLWIFGITTLITTIWALYSNGEKTKLEKQLNLKDERIKKLESKITTLDSILKSKAHISYPRQKEKKISKK